MAFNQEAFLANAIKGEMATERPLFPEGEFVGEIMDVEAKPTKNDKYLLFILSMQVNDEEVATEMNREAPVKYKFTILVELDENGGMATGKASNVLLGQLRAALGQNSKAKAWKPTDVIGHNVLFAVGHRLNKDNGQTQDGITAFASPDNESTEE